MAIPKHTNWSPDNALAGFEARTLSFPDDYDGEVYATLIRRQADNHTHQAVLYIHGYMDYFFQPHLAQQYNQHGYNFYALDLRKYGRSLNSTTHHPNFCKDMSEYFAEISAALRIITAEDHNQWILLNGHSTGGLLSCLYAASGTERQRINALYLNSPFFAFNFKKMLRFIIIILAILLGQLFPFLLLEQKRPLPYIQSIHQDHHGEWPFDLRWRELTGFPIYLGWLKAIHRAHQQVRQGLNLPQPILVMHSDKSVYGRSWRPAFQSGDAVLNVKHIRQGSQHLGPQVKVIEIKDGLHDLILSRQDVRETLFTELFSWLDSLDKQI